MHRKISFLFSVSSFSLSDANAASVTDTRNCLLLVDRWTLQPELISLLATSNMHKHTNPKQPCIFGWWAFRCTNTYDDDVKLVFTMDPVWRSNLNKTQLIFEDWISQSKSIERSWTLISNARRPTREVYKSFGNPILCHLTGKRQPPGQCAKRDWRLNKRVSDNMFINLGFALDTNDTWTEAFLI